MKTGLILRKFFKGAAAFCVTVSSALAEGDVNLLDPEIGKFESFLMPGGQSDAVQELLDNDPETGALFDIPTNEVVSLDLVFSFTGEGVAPEELVLTNWDAGGGERPARFDILYSSVSASSGYRTIRDGPLDALKPSEKFKLPVGGANWVMLRLYPAEGAASLALADVALLGRVGTPETKYKFGESPAAALDIIAELSAFGSGDFDLTEDERDVFSRSKDGILDQRDFENIALIASGVRDPGRRNAFIEQIDALEAEARGNLDVSAPPKELGERLLLWLHDTVLTEGYVERQTNLSEVLSGNRFNCVSSAVLYNVIGQRLGLDLRAIEVPDHAFSILYDGADHFDVETTTARGFNPHRERIEEFEKLTGYAYIPQSNKSKRREIGRAGLAALIYYNHGVGYLKDGDYYNALLANFRALSLDPELKSAATNALAAMGRWSRDLARSGEWEDATRVAALGRKLAPEDRALVSNEMRVWRDFALAIAETEGPEAGLAILQRGALGVPDADFEPLRSALFIRPGEAAIKSGDWTSAHKIADRGLALLTDTALTDVNSWKEQLFLRQSRQEMNESRFEAAAEILFDGRSTYPESKKVSRALAYLAQSWSDQTEDYDESISVLRKFSDRFAPLAGLDGVVERNVLKRIRAASGNKVPRDTALEMAKRSEELLAAIGSDTAVAPLVYRIYGERLIDAKDWQAAARLYSEGLGRFVDDYYIKQNARFVVQEWQRAALAAGGNTELEAVVAQLRTLFPSFSQNKGFGEKELKREVLKRVNAKDYAAALEYLNSAQLLLSDETYRDLRLYIVDHEANGAMKAHNWPRAAQLYATGRAEIGEPKIFSNNIAYIAQEWTKAEGQAGGAEAVARTMEILIDHFPHDKAVAEMGGRTLKRLVSEMVRKDRLEEAKSQLVLARRFLSPKELRSLTIVLYRDYGNHLIDRRDWSGALTAYMSGLEIVPDSSDLGRNVPFAFQEWAREALATGRPEDFLAAVQQMKAVFPNAKSLPNVLENVLSEKAASAVKVGDAEEALAWVNAVSSELDSDTVHSVKVFVYEKWARQSFESDWAKVVAIYTRGLEDVGKSSLLSNNLAYAKSKLN
ncbi:hypothetical protein AB2B41_19635 [Marimonas sp. MJW-29]|uniref:Protein SirB1 N-terminal domain-containing protein n=1 Tax=Sulfitobacter sediminis TaxID=3234186 RepID=A0ABV3RS90_9RHOB